MTDEQQAPPEEAAVAEMPVPEGPHSEWHPAYRSWSQVVARYRSQHARSGEEDGHSYSSDRTRLASPRTIGATSHIFILTRLQLMIAAVLGAVLLDFVIAGSMREALRYSVLDAPRQFPAIIVALLLVCAALRYSAEAMIELVSPDLFDAQGNIGHLAHFLPRVLAMFVGVAAGYPLIKLAFDVDALGSWDNCLFAGVFGAIFVSTGLLVGIVGKGPHASARSALTRRSSWLLRLALAILPLVAVVGLAATLWGVFQAFHPTHYSGIASGALDRYLHGSIVVRLAHMAIEALGIFVTAIFARLAFNVLIYLIAPNAMTSPGIVGAIAAWIPRIAAAAIGFVLTVQVIMLYGSEQLPADERYWLLGIALAYSAIALLAALIDGSFSVVTDSSTIFQRTGSRWLLGAERMAALDGRWRLFFAVLLIAALIVFLAFADVSRVAQAQEIGPIAIILLWGFSATALFFPIAYMSHATRMPLLLFLLFAGMAFAGFDINDNHQLRGASSEPPTPEQTAAAAVQAAAEADAAQSTPTTYYGEELQLGEWLASRQDWQAYERYPIFLIATEGGGIRAAYFTASVLAALQEKCPAFAQHVFAISSVSGGSVGAAVFASQAAEQARNVQSIGCNLGPIAHDESVIVERARKTLSTDLLSPLLGAALFPDALQRVLPLPIEQFDRARALEYALEDSWRRNTPACSTCDPERMSRPVRTLYPSAAIRGPVPHLFLNTTEVGSGLSVPFATVVPNLLSVEDDVPHLQNGNSVQTIRPVVTLQSKMIEDEVPLSAAAMVSARFPYLTPAARIGQVGHYVDGGYFENSGGWLISGLAQKLIGQRLRFASDNKALERAVQNTVIVVVVIHSAPCETCNDQGQQEIVDRDRASTWNEVLSPLRALIYTRDQRASYSIGDLDALTKLVQRVAPPKPGEAAAAPASTASTDTRAAMAQIADASAAVKATECTNTICLVTLSFHNKSTAEVPLSWVLSSAARGAMDQAVDQILSENLRAPPPPGTNAVDDNRLDGSYRRIMCLLQSNDSSAAACTMGAEN